MSPRQIFLYCGCQGIKFNKTQSSDYVQNCLLYSWVIEGGELNTSCGVIYDGQAVVMSGRSKVRKLCTPYMDLQDAGTIHFYYSQGEGFYYCHH